MRYGKATIYSLKWAISIEIRMSLQCYPPSQFVWNNKSLTRGMWIPGGTAR